MIRRGIGVGSFVSAGGAAPVDADAQAFIDAAGITDATQQSAINTLVTDLKGYGIWSKMKAIWPFVGGTSSTHKWNLKDPRDLDAAFRLVFSGGWTHSSTGALPNGTNGYADTKLNPSSILTQNSTHLATYLRTDTNGLHMDIGASTNTTSSSILIYGRFSGNSIADTGFYLTSRISVAVANSLGLYTIKRTANNNLKLFKNGSEIGNNTTTDNTLLPNSTTYISAINDGTGALSQFSNRQVAFASIGDGLTDTEAANLYTAVQAYQTTLSRNV